MKCCPKLPIAFIIVFVFGAFFYYQYSFSSVSKIHFGEDSFYQYKDGMVDVFVPKDLKYQLCFYSSFMDQSQEFLDKNFKPSLKLLAIDFYQQGSYKTKDSSKKEAFIEVRISSNTMLKLIHSFNLKYLPQCFIIAQSPKDSMQYTHLKDFGLYKIINFREK